MNPRTWYQGGKLLVGIVMAMLFSGPVVSAQGTGTVKGRVLDKATGDALIGANVMIVNTSLGVAADKDGSFVIRYVPTGEQTLKVSYIGYIAVTRKITVSADSVVNEEFKMTPQAIEGETIVVTAQAQGQNEAINQQLSSNTITNVVSAARIKELPDVNAAESVGRLPGVAIIRSGGEANNVNIRGLDPKYNLVTVNGNRLPSTSDDRNTSLLTSVGRNNANPSGYRFGGDDRSVDLSLISSNTLDGIELKKAITPDMDADVLGGTVDLKLKEAPPGYHIGLAGQGGYNQLQNYYGNYNFAGSVSNRFLDDELGVILAANADHYDRSADKLNATYGDFLNGGVPTGATIEKSGASFNLREEKVIRERTGGNMLLDLNVPNGKVSGDLFFSRLRSKATYRTNFFDPFDQRHNFNIEDRHGTTNVFTGSLGVKQDYGWIRFDAGASRTGTEGDSPDERGFSFVQNGGNTFTSGWTADTTTTPLEVVQHAVVDTAGTKLSTAYRFFTTRREYESTVQLNVAAPFALGDLLSGYVKVGGKFRELNRSNDEDVYGITGLEDGGGINITIPLVRTLSQLYPDEWNFERDSADIRIHNWFPVTRFLGDYSRSNFLNGQYPLGLAIDPSKVNELMEAMLVTPNTYVHQWLPSLARDYDGVERYHAAYVMSEVHLADYVTVIPGVRWERDYSLYHGQRFRALAPGGVGNAQLQFPADYQPLTAERHNEFVLPIVHVNVTPIDWLKVRMAYTNTLSRPDFILYAPITFINDNQTQIVAANSQLRPARSKNVDVSATAVDNSIGLITLSGFYKQIDDLIYSSTYSGINLKYGTPLPPPGSNIPRSWLVDSTGQFYATPTIYSYNMNNPTPGYIRGVELEWQTHFWYLPSVLQGLVLSVNYTRMGSNVDIHYYTPHDSVVRRVPPIIAKRQVDTSTTVRVPGTPSSIINITLGYDYEGFSTRLSYLYQSDRVTGISISDQYNGSSTLAYERWDLTVQQSLFDWGVQLYANFSNLNARPDEATLNYQYYHPTSLEYYGFTMDVGVRFKL